ncbi:hypothetical protein BJ546DRAFT_1049934 [Cryomyces antarcticus]
MIGPVGSSSCSVEPQRIGVRTRSRRTAYGLQEPLGRTAQRDALRNLDVMKQRPESANYKAPHEHSRVNAWPRIQACKTETMRCHGVGGSCWQKRHRYQAALEPLSTRMPRAEKVPSGCQVVRAGAKCQVSRLRVWNQGPNCDPVLSAPSRDTRDEFLRTQGLQATEGYLYLTCGLDDEQQMPRESDAMAGSTSMRRPRRASSFRLRRAEKVESRKSAPPLRSYTPRRESGAAEASHTYTWG